MDIAYLSLIIFVLITIIYFAFPSVGKLSLTIDILQAGELDLYYKNNLSRLGLYFLATILSQFVINVIYLVNKCGGSAGNNIGAAALFTFIPWVFIFGILIVVLFMFPGIKSAFSDVVGYFAISGKANNILSSILLDTEVKEAIENAQGSMEEKSKMSKSAEAVMKMFGNKSIIINQMNPENFLSVWDILKPLMVHGGNIPGIEEKQRELLQLTVIRDNIGEALWYIYSAILISSIVSYNLATRGCIKDVSQIKQEHDAYVQQQEEIQKQQELNNSTTMKLT
jgi:hypothetical protein